MPQFLPEMRHTNNRSELNGDILEFNVQKNGTNENFRVDHGHNNRKTEKSLILGTK